MQAQSAIHQSQTNWLNYIFLLAPDGRLARPTRVSWLISNPEPTRGYCPIIFAFDKDVSESECDMSAHFSFADTRLYTVTIDHSSKYVPTGVMSLLPSVPKWHSIIHHKMNQPTTNHYTDQPTNWCTGYGFIRSCFPSLEVNVVHIWLYWSIIVSYLIPSFCLNCLAILSPYLLP